MPSLVHEALVDMFRDRPALIVDLLRVLHVEVPAYATITIADVNLADLKPAPLSADLVLELCDAAGDPQLTAILEVQLRPDDDKLGTWPNYLTTRRRSRRCPTCVLVLTPSREVAAWARRPIALGPGNPEFRVLVLGPDEVPVITDHGAAVANPLLAFLSALTHGNDEPDGVAVLDAVLAALTCFDKPTVQVYLHLLDRALSETRRRILKEKAMLNINPDEIPLASFLVPVVEHLTQRQRAGDILRILDIRKVALTSEQRAEIRDCTDPDRIDAWIDRAALARTADDVFDPPADAK